MHRTSPSDLLPAACIVGIFAGFIAYLYFGGEQLILCFLAAAIGAVVGILIASDSDSSPVQRETAHHRYSSNSSRPF